MNHNMGLVIDIIINKFLSLYIFKQKIKNYITIKSFAFVLLLVEQ